MGNRSGFSRKIGTTKEPLGLGSILIAYSRHVETVVLLSHKKPDSVINVKVEFGEGEDKVPLGEIAKKAEAYKPKGRVTYKMIKEYIEENYGFKMHTAYIAEVKSDLCIIGLNSCRLESMTNAGFGYVGDEQLDKVQKYLNANKDIDVICVVCHHHLLPVNYIEEISTNEKKISMMLDAELVIRNLIANGVNVILHGHQHQPYYSQIRRIIPEYIDKLGEKVNLDGTLSIVGGGSCGVKQSKINVIGRNTYNLLNFNDNDELIIKTRIKSGNGIGFYDDGELILKL